MRSLALATFLLCTLLAPGGPPVASLGDPMADAVQHYRAGRYAEAMAGFQALLAERGDAAPPELLTNAALAALRIQRPGDAEALARRLTLLADAQERAAGSFLAAQAVWQRAERSAAAARLQDAEPFAWTAAVRSAEQAIQRWLQADRECTGWPAALRNAERAAQELAMWRREREAAEQNRQSPKREPDPPPPPTAKGEAPEEQDPALVQSKLGAADLARVWENLQRKNREKRLSRQANQQRITTAGERDW